jgi:hypothetical protein
MAKPYTRQDYLTREFKKDCGRSQTLEFKMKLLSIYAEGIT